MRVVLFVSRTVEGEYMADVTFTDSNFESDVMKAEKPVLVDFWAVWCGPCRMQGPIVDELAKDFSGKAVVGKMNVDENPQVSQTLGIMSIPTLMIFHKGQMVKQFIGVQSKETLEKELKKLTN
jgi:thioredoxin 1